jgi:hypothetical protein
VNVFLVVSGHDDDAEERREQAAFRYHLAAAVDLLHDPERSAQLRDSHPEQYDDHSLQNICIRLLLLLLLLLLFYFFRLYNFYACYFSIDFFLPPGMLNSSIFLP